MNERIIMRTEDRAVLDGTATWVSTWAALDGAWLSRSLPGGGLSMDGLGAFLLEADVLSCWSKSYNIGVLALLVAWLVASGQVSTSSGRLRASSERRDVTDSVCRVVVIAEARRRGAYYVM